MARCMGVDPATSELGVRFSPPFCCWRCVRSCCIGVKRPVGERTLTLCRGIRVLLERGGVPVTAAPAAAAAALVCASSWGSMRARSKSDCACWFCSCWSASLRAPVLGSTGEADGAEYCSACACACACGCACWCWCWCCASEDLALESDSDDDQVEVAEGVAAEEEAARAGPGPRGRASRSRSRSWAGADARACERARGGSAADECCGRRAEKLCDDAGFDEKEVDEDDVDDENERGCCCSWSCCW